MILAEKISQKLSNLQSKNEIADYFLYFDESRGLKFRVENGAIGKHTHPTHYSEYSEGNFVIVWNNNSISKGEISNTSISNFDEFISNAQKTANKVKGIPFIPERGIYPMVRAYSKTLADMVDVPEYILKLADILQELDKMVGSKEGYAEIDFADGTRYAYSSRKLDEYYPYTLFTLTKVFKNNFRWYLNTSDIFSINKFEELFSFLGNTYNILNTSTHKSLKSGKYDLIIPPHLFKKIFEEQVLKQLEGKLISQNRSIFTKLNFDQKLKCIGSLSLSYDPLLNLKPGSYKFTDFGLKAQKQYFIKFGKLDTPILENLSYSELGYKVPTMQIKDFGNLKFEGLKKKTFADSVKSDEETLYMPDFLRITKKSPINFSIYGGKAIVFDSKGNGKNTGKPYFHINLYELIKSNSVELVEFVDGQLGLKIIGLDVKFV